MEILSVMAIIYFISRLLSGKMVEMLCNADVSACRVLNYRGRAIPAIGGIVFVPIMLSAILLLLFLYPHRFSEYQRLLMLICCMGFIGILDDLAGDKHIKGIVMHIRSTFYGHMTTGFIKASTGFLAAGIASMQTSAGIPELMLNTLVIALGSNTLNLFDLRPGRAIKVYILAALLLLFVALPDITDVLPLLALLIAVFAFSSYDLKEICMLGDTGANVLGATLGFYSILLLGTGARLAIAAVLTVINLAAEKISISSLINNSRFLSYLDSLGRGDSSRDDRA